MSVPVAHFKQTGKEALDQFLQKTVQDKKVPATFLGVTNKDGELYFDCGGDRVYGKPDEGQVTPDTGELFTLTLISDI
jgi:methyl acetate hydrolase